MGKVIYAKDRFPEKFEFVSVESKAINSWEQYAHDCEKLIEKLAFFSIGSFLLNFAGFIYIILRIFS
jgi:hypothetical protein